MEGATDAENQPAPTDVTTQKNEGTGKARRHGIARIKPQYLDNDHKPKLALQYLPKAVIEEYNTITKQPQDSEQGSAEATSTDAPEETSEPPKKKVKLKGRNKKRPREQRIAAEDKLCPNVLFERDCRFGENCRFSHDLKAYIENKPADLGDKCYAFETYGKCDYGVSCMFARSHLTEDYKNKINPELYAKYENKSEVKNVLSKDLQIKLRKREYSFKRAYKVVNQVQKELKKKTEASKGNKPSHNKDVAAEDTQNQHLPPPKEEQGHSETQSPKSSPNISESTDNNTLDDSVKDLDSEAQASEPLAASSNGGGANVSDAPVTSTSDVTVRRHSPSGAITDEAVIKLRPQEKKVINFADKLYLAPLTTVGNLPFRRICKNYGADITCGEMAVVTNLLQGQTSEWALTKRHESEDIFGVQLCGSFPDTMTKCAQVLTERSEIDFIDINCGCPIDLVFKRGEGCAIMSRNNRFEHIVRSMTRIMDIPLTVKIRTGIYEDKNIAHTLVPKLRDWGVSMVTVHGRSREQRYTRLADWDYIDQCAKMAAPMPVFGNGDILSFEDYIEHREKTQVSGAMIARGALIKPWLFTEIHEQRLWDISASERLDMLRQYVNTGLTYWGSDQQGVNTTRRFLLEWLSFLHRYIPVGLLERQPQKINEKPPYYFGRNDLETLMASANCADWVKISEMLLGPVPSDFTFLPKHKANAYQ